MRTPAEQAIFDAMTPEERVEFDARSPEQQATALRGQAMRAHLQSNPRTKAKLEKAVWLLEDLWSACEGLPRDPLAFGNMIGARWAEWHDQNVEPFPR